MGSMESALTLLDRVWPMNLVAVARLAPAPDTDHLTEALARAQQRHPALRARIDGRLFVYDDVPAIPLHVHDRTGDDDWLAEAERLLNEPLPAATGPLATATLLRGDDAGDLVMAFHHAAADGASVAALLDEVLGDREGEALPVPPSADDLDPLDGIGGKAKLAGHLAREMAGEPRYRLAMRRAGGPSVDRQARTQIAHTALDQDATTRLTQAARRRRLTVPSVVQAALLTTVHRARYDSANAPLRTFSFADLRPRFEPPATAEPLACYVALTSQDIQPSDDLWETAARVQQAVEASVRGDAKFLAARAAQPLMRMALATKRLRMGNTALSYTATLGLDRPEVGGVHAFVSNLPIGPELAMRAGIANSRLTLDATSLDTDMDRTEMRAQLDGIAATLAGAASPTQE